MSVYIVGDLQGCFSCLQSLLDKTGFSPGRDQLWAVGDLVNRGPESLQTLRFCKSLGSSFRTVLGNHDLHLLAVAHGARAPGHKDTLSDILNAPDRHDLLDWLQNQPLVTQAGGLTLVHAGIPPMWDLDEAMHRAREVETVLARESGARAFLQGMYGNEPKRWRDDLEGSERLRMITNYFTRMRYCDERGTLELTNKQAPPNGPPGYRPWFAHDNRRAAGAPIAFGHWASLNGVCRVPGLHALDTGCVWGGRLRALSLDTGHYIHHNCNLS